MFTRTLAISALLSFAAAQSLSAGCTKALTTIATSPEANACLTPSPLISIITNPSASIIDPINNWLGSLCAAPSCSNATLAAIVQNATAGCPTELAGLGFQTNDTTAITTIVQQYYPTVRKVVCLKEGNTNCITQTLTNLQNTVGTLSISNIANLTTALQSPNVPQNVSCTNCIKAATNIIRTDMPGLLNDQSLQTQCGASFTDGATPSGISQTASNTVVKGSGALGLGAFSVASLLVAISSGFALLA